jgi:hypothetical protein
MPKSRKFRKNSIDFKYGFEPGLIEQALIKAKRDVPFTELRKFLPRTKPMVFYRQKNHGKYREPSIVILNQKIQGRSKKMGRRPSIGKHKKTRRNRTKKYRRGMMGGVTDPSTPRGPDNNIQTPPQVQKIKGPNPTSVDVQGQGVAINLESQLAQEPTNDQTGEIN